MIPRQKSFIEQIAAAEPIRYDQQVIIDFTGEGLASGLKRKWDKHHSKSHCLLLNGKVFLNAKDRCPLISKSRIRIYLITHGNPMGLFENLLNRINLKMLMERIVFYMQDNDYVLNILSCGSARGEKINPTQNNQKSVACEIHQLLQSCAKRDIPVIARTHVLAGFSSLVSKKNIKLTANLDKPWTGSPDKKSYEFIKRQPGSKLIICNNENGQEIIIDGYFSTWRNRVFKVMEKLILKEKNPEQKEYLQAGFEKLKSEPAERIYAIIKNVVDNPKSRLNVGASFFKSNTRTAPKKLKELITEWEQIQKSIYTVKETRFIHRKSKIP